MQYCKIILLLFFVSFMSCKKKENLGTENILVRDNTNSHTQNNIDSSNVLEKKFSYQFKFSDTNSHQIVGINLVDSKTIEFHLITETLPCDTEYYGIAVNKNWNLDGEIDEDDEGGYFVNEYFKEAEEYTIAIRLAEDLSKVQIKYIQNNGLETDCLPITQKIMYRLNN
jgi:hypothetical protein